MPIKELIKSGRIDKNYLMAFLKNYGTLVGLLILIICFSLLSNRFLSFRNIVNILRQISMISIISCGMTYVVLMGEIDLSVGSVAGLSGIICAYSLAAGWGVLIAIIAALFTGMLIGYFNAVLVTKIKIPSFICTLATMSICNGIILTITKGTPIYRGFTSAFLLIGGGYIWFLPTPVFILIVVAFIAYYHLTFTKQGRHIHAVGGNIEAARLSGISTMKIMSFGFVLCGLASSISGIIVTSRLASGHPASGNVFLLDTIAAVFVGSTIIEEGEANIIGSIMGALLIGVLSNGLTLLNVPYYFQDIAKGLIIILAVAVASTQKMGKTSL